jgi:hypothetical protein
VRRTCRNDLPVWAHGLCPCALLRARIGPDAGGGPRGPTAGATDAELGRALPGDDLVDSPTFDATRAITIGASPAQVWPWLVQVGVNRAGWYSYDLLDNLGRPSARQVVPDLQHIRPGDLLPMSPDGQHGIRVHALDRPHWMIWGTPGDTSWVWVLDPLPDGSTRLITRVRSDPRWRPSSLAFAVILEFADFPMIRRMLLNLRDRIEAAADTSPRRRAKRRPRRRRESRLRDDIGHRSNHST